MNAVDRLRIIQGIACPTCRNYAWSLDRMRPVMREKRWHHPSCATLVPRAPMVTIHVYKVYT